MNKPIFYRLFGWRTRKKGLIRKLREEREFWHWMYACSKKDGYSRKEALKNILGLNRRIQQLKKIGVNK
jgi:hypothetical protein